MARFQSEKLKQEVVLRDPVHGYIHIEDKVIFDLVKSKEFQRMRRIKQLGPVIYVFPGATHTRFEHNLGVYELTRRICDIFAKKYPSIIPGDGLWDDDNRLLVELCWPASRHRPRPLFAHIRAPFWHQPRKDWAKDHQGS